LETTLVSDFQLQAPIREWLKAEPDLSDETLRERTRELAVKQYETKLALVGPETFHQFERNLMLTTLDQQWREHLAALDHLRQGIHLRGYAQKNPKQEYKREAFELFGAMIEAVKLEVIKTLTAVEIRTEEDIKPGDQSHGEDAQPVHP